MAVEARALLPPAFLWVRIHLHSDRIHFLMRSARRRDPRFPERLARRWVWTFIILDFHTGGFCGLRIYLLALGFVGLPQVESIIRGFATTTRQRAHVTLLSSLPWASLLLFSCEVAPSAVIRDLLNSACESALVRRRAGRKPRMSSVRGPMRCRNWR